MPTSKKSFKIHVFKRSAPHHELTPEARNALTHPVDMALLRMTDCVSNVEDWQLIYFRLLIGFEIAGKFYTEDVVVNFNEAIKLMNEVHARHYEKEGPWMLKPDERATLFDRHMEVIQMHNEIPRKHLLPLYKKLQAKAKGQG